MLQFDKSHNEELKKYLFNSYIHDAAFEEIKYDVESREVTVHIVNSIHQRKYKIIFSDVVLFIVSVENENGKHKTINSLTIEEEAPFLPNCIKKDYISTECMYMLFQMIYGDEVHVVFKKVIFEET